MLADREPRLAAGRCSWVPTKLVCMATRYWRAEGERWTPSGSLEGPISFSPALHQHSRIRQKGGMPNSTHPIQSFETSEEWTTSLTAWNERAWNGKVEPHLKLQKLSWRSTSRGAQLAPQPLHLIPPIPSACPPVTLTWSPAKGGGEERKGTERRPRPEEKFDSTHSTQKIVKDAREGNISQSEEARGIFPSPNRGYAPAFRTPSSIAVGVAADGEGMAEART